MPIVTTEMPVEGDAGASQVGEPEKTTTETAPQDKKAGESPEAAETKSEADPDALADDDGDDDDDDEGDDGSKKKGEVPRGVRKKLHKLTSEIDFLRDQLAKAIERPAQAPTPAVQEPVQGDGEPSPDDFESYVDYMTARAEWKAEQKVKETLTRERQTAAMQAQHAEFMKKVEPFRVEFKDFDTVIQSVPKDIVPSPEFQQAIALSDLGPLVGYTLAKDQTELRRIMALPPVLQVLEFGKIEQKLAAARAKPKETRATKATPPAPPPPDILDKGTTVKTQTPADVANDYMAWKKLREAEIKAKRGSK